MVDSLNLARREEIRLEYHWGCRTLQRKSDERFPPRWLAYQINVPDMAQYLDTEVACYPFLLTCLGEKLKIANTDTIIVATKITINASKFNC